MTSGGAGSSRAVLAPLALTQFIASFAGSNMNVAISSITKDLHTTSHGVSSAITLFLLTMAALMIPGSKLTDRWGRKRCLIRGLGVYGIGAVISAGAGLLGLTSLATLIVGYSLFQGVGSALMIPPIYILATILYGDLASRARAFGVISGMGGIGAAAGPLIGGTITTTLSWRWSFVLQAAVVATIIGLSRRIDDPLPADPARPFDAVGAVLSAAGMAFLVLGILQAGINNPLMVAFLALGGALTVWFFLRARSQERAGHEPLLSVTLFRNRTSNLGLVTQNVQWGVLLGSSLAISLYLQDWRHYSPIKTGVIFTAATAGILISSLAAERLTRRYAQRTLILTGFVGAVAGIGLLIGLVMAWSSDWAFVPGLLVFGLALGTMLTPSVNIVQSAFSEAKQGEISGLSRAVSNLGSSIGTAIAGTIIVTDLAHGNRTYAIAMGAMGALAVIGFAAAVFLRTNPVATTATRATVTPLTGAAGDVSPGGER